MDRRHHSSNVSTNSLRHHSDWDTNPTCKHQFTDYRHQAVRTSIFYASTNLLTSGTDLNGYQSFCANTNLQFSGTNLNGDYNLLFLFFNTD